jgi:hypothetical protein
MCNVSGANCRAGAIEISDDRTMVYRNDHHGSSIMFEFQTVFRKCLGRSEKVCAPGWAAGTGGGFLRNRIR